MDVWTPEGSPFRSFHRNKTPSSPITGRALFKNSIIDGSNTEFKALSGESEASSIAKQYDDVDFGKDFFQEQHLSDSNIYLPVPIEHTQNQDQWIKMQLTNGDYCYVNKTKKTNPILESDFKEIVEQEFMRKPPSI